ncbi:MAG: SGNH/GDSL hydrolase family protein [Planctomycetota bacterium]
MSQSFTASYPAARFEPLEPRRLMSAEPLQILALGDSLTLGIGSIDQSYRAALTQRLDRAGVNYDMVGALSDGSGYDNDHFAIQGSRAADSYTNSKGEFILSATDAFRQGRVLDAGEKPDVILLHIGINTARFDPNRAADELHTLLEEMADQWRAGAFASDVQVLLAEIVPGSRGEDKTVDPGGVARTQAYNDQIAPVLNALSDRAFAERITTVNFFRAAVDGLDLSSSRRADAQNDGDPWVDWFGNIDEANAQATATGNPDLMRSGDWLHPTAAGYDVMGAIWFRALEEQGLLQATSDPPAPAPPAPTPAPPAPTPTPPAPTPTPPPPAAPLIQEALPGNYALAGRGDFDNDGDIDFIFRDRDSNRTLLRLATPDGRVDTEARGPDLEDKWSRRSRSWADFDNSGTQDALWISKNREVMVWRMDGTDVDVRLASQRVPIGSRFGTVRDANGDGFADLTWTNGRGTFVWEMRAGELNRIDRSGVVVRAPVNAPAGFRVAVNGDFDRDGRNDRIFRNDAGDTRLRFATGETVTTLGIGAGWRPRPAADLDGDGDLDVRWNLPNGDARVWLFENGRFVEAEERDEREGGFFFNFSLGGSSFGLRS